MLVYPSSFIVMFLRTHCSSAVPLGVHIPCVMLTMSIIHLTTANLSVFMTFIERTGCASEKAENFDFRPPELHLGTFVAWKV